MVTSSFDSVYSLASTQIIVPVGATLAVLVTSIAGQNALMLKQYGGGTLEIIGMPDGSTLTAASLATASGNHYIMGASEVLSFDGPTRIYLSSTGATSVVMSLRGKSQGL
jgi:hypothetical protein